MSPIHTTLILNFEKSIFSYELDDQLLIITTEGNFQPEDLQKTFLQVFSDPDFRPGTKILVHDLDLVFVPTSKQIEAGAKNIET